MTTELVLATGKLPVAFAGRHSPAMIIQAGPDASRRFVEFFTANIRNPNTRAAYARAVGQFMEWCEARKLSLKDLSPFLVAAYVEQLSQRGPRERAVCRRTPDGRPFTSTASTHALTPPAVKQHLAAIRMLFVGLRDRAFIGVMVFSFARVGAVCGMKVEDYYQNGKRCWFRLHEKGGKSHEVPAHHNAQAYLDEYLSASGIAQEKKTPLFRAAAGRTNTLSESGVSRTDVFRMIKRRVVAAGLPARICCHTFRATGITAYLEAGGTIENAQAIAAHESPRTTKLYDRTNSELTLDEIERIAI